MSGSALRAPTIQPLLLPVSGRDAAALAANAGRLAGYLRDRPEVSLRDLCYTLGVRRSHGDLRAALHGSREQVVAGLDALAAGETAAPEPAARTVFAIGDGAARALCEARWEPFAQQLAAVAAASGTEIGADFWARAEAELGGELARFAAAGSLCEAWQRWGVAPDRVLATAPELAGALAAAGPSSLEAALERMGASVAASLPAGWSLAAGETELAAAIIAPGEGELVLRVDELRGEDPGWSLSAQLCRCYGAGLPLRWERVLPGGELVDAPTYAFQRQRFPLGATAGDEVPAAVPPSGGLERQAAIEVLGLASEQLEDERSLSDYGMDSLLALELREVLGRRGAWIDLEVFAANPSVADLIAAPRSAGPAAGTGELPACPEDTPFRLTEIQHAYWVGRTGFVDLGDVSCHFYAELEVEDLDLERLQRALDRLIARHDALRLVIDENGRQRVLSEVPAYAVEVVDLAAAPDFEAACERERERVSHEIRPADTWPLFSWRLLDRGGRSGVLQVSYDLLIADAASLLILTDELIRAYAEPAVELEPVGVSFAQCVLAEPPAGAAERARSYWATRIEEIPDPPALPLATAAEDLERQRFHRLGAVVEDSVWSDVVANAKQHGLTATAALCAAYAAVLGEWSSASRFALNVTVYRRPPIHPDVHRVIGDFTSFDLLAVELGGEPGFADLARDLKLQLWRDIAHIEGAGIHLLRELSERHGEPFFAPVVFTSLLGFEDDSRLLSLDSLGRRRYTSTQTPQVWLDHQALRVPGGVELTWDFVAGLLDEATVGASFERYRELVGVLADPGAWGRPAADLLAGLTSPAAVAAKPGPAAAAASPRPRPAAAGAELLAEMKELVTEALPLGELDVDADLLAAGATSLEIIQLAGRLERRFGTRPRVRDLYRVGTIRGLAEYYAERIAGGEGGAPAVLADAAARDQARRGEAPARGAGDGIPLPAAEPAGLPAAGRRSCRAFGPASLDRLAALLTALRATAEGRRRFPSAGASYPVRAVVHVPGDGVAGLAAGVYDYDPREHALVPLAGDGELDRNVHWPSNRETYERAAFGIFLVGEMATIEPLYGELAHEFCLVEAGAITQLLMETAAAAGLGLCPIGGLDVAPVRALCQLGESEPVLLGLLGGAPASATEPVEVPQICGVGELAARVPALAVASLARTALPRGSGEVLLTGATGFLGSHLLRGLLDEGRRVLCLTRAADAGAAAARIHGALEQHLLWRPDDERQIVPVAGDLADPAWLGEVSAVATGGVADIFHSASLVNWVLSAGQLWEANVAGTKAIAEFAASSGARLHHISSTAIFPFGAGRSYGEDDPLDHGGALSGGYPQTKWVAERLARDAREIGVDVTVYRPGIIAGSASTGSTNPRGFFESMIRGCSELGVAPRLEMDLDVAPVDFVARALVALAGREVAETIHLVNPNPIRYADMMRWIRGRGYEIRETGFDSWRDEVLGGEAIEGTALGPFVDYLMFADAERLTLPAIRCENALAGLEGTGIACPPLDGALLDTYVAQLVDRDSGRGGGEPGAER